MQAAKAGMRCLVSGKVQGVWFRAHTKEQADGLGLVGCAKNLPDGRVEVLAYGEPSALDRLEQWLHQGSPKSQVEEVERQEESWKDCQRFVVS